MIDGVGKNVPGRIDLARSDKSGTPAAPTLAGKGADAGSPQSAVFELVAGGAPVDQAKVSAVRAAIADGRYPVDPARIAARMMAMDLPER